MVGISQADFDPVRRGRVGDLGSIRLRVHRVSDSGGQVPPGTVDSRRRNDGRSLHSDDYTGRTFSTLRQYADMWGWESVSILHEGRWDRSGGKTWSFLKAFKIFGKLPPIQLCLRESSRKAEGGRERIKRNRPVISLISPWYMTKNLLSVGSTDFVAWPSLTSASLSP